MQENTFHVSGDGWRPRDAAWDIGALEGACWGHKAGGGGNVPHISPGVRKISGLDPGEINKVAGIQ